MSQDQHEHELGSEDGEIVFRVLAGLQRGAEMSLQPGSYLIGSGEECDIVLTDDAVADDHFSIEVSENGLVFKSHNGAVAAGEMLLRSGEEANASTPIALSLGETVLGIGMRDTDWNALTFPDLAAMMNASETDASEEEEEADEPDLAEEGEVSEDDDLNDDAVNGLGDDTSEENEAEPDQLADEAEASESDEEADKEETPLSALLARFDTQSRRVAAGVAFIVFTGVVVLLFAHGAGSAQAAREEQEVAEAKRAEASDAIRKLIVDAGLLEVEAKHDKQGMYHLSGYVADETARKVLHSILVEAQVSFHDQVRQVDEIMRAVEISLEKYSWPVSGFNRHLIPNYIGGGIFSVDGYLGPEVDRTDLNRQIVMDAPGVVRVDFKRARLADWQAELEEELDRAGLTPWIKTSIVDGGLRVSGEITPREADVWRKIGQGFVDKSRGWPKLSIAVRAAGAHYLQASGAAAPVLAAAVPAPRPTRSNSLNVIGVIMPSDGPGRVLLNNGTSRAEGEALYDGAILQSVSLNKITVRKEGKIHEFHVGDRG